MENRIRKESECMERKPAQKKLVQSKICQQLSGVGKRESETPSEHGPSTELVNLPPVKRGC